MKDKERSEKMLRAVGHVGEDLIADAEAPVKRRPAKKLLFALIAAVLVVAMIATPVAIIMAHRAKTPVDPGSTTVPGENGRISFSGSAYTTDAAVDLPDSLREIKVTVDGANSRFISPSSTFTVQTAGDCDPETLGQHLTILPKTDLSVKQTAKDTFEIEPAKGTLIPGSVYRVILGDPKNPTVSYAFQTENETVVKSILPGNETTGAPVDTGIEITFSEAVDTKNIEDFIKITPEVKGEFYFYPDGRTVAFVPEKALMYNSVYTVKVLPGVIGVSGKKTAEERVSVFRTAAENEQDEDRDVGVSLRFVNSSYGSASSLDTVFGTDDTASLVLNYYKYYGVTDSSDVTVTLYKFPTVRDAYEIILDSEKHRGDMTFGNKTYDLQKLAKIADYTIAAKGAENLNNQRVVFGGGLEKGVYLAMASVTAYAGNKSKDFTCSAFFQISDLCKFTLSSDGKTLLWMNKAGSGAVYGASIEGVSYKRNSLFNAEDLPDIEFTKISGKTGKDGAFVIENKSGDASLLRVSAAGDELLIAAYSAETDTNKYAMKFLYTDRETYFSSDTVRLYGFICPVYGTEISDELYLQTGYSSLKQKLNVEKDGSFTAEYKIESMRAGGLYLKIVDADGRVYASKSIRVTEEEKPQITASLTFDKPFYRYGETVRVTLASTFFDGTPAPGRQFSLSVNPFGQSFDMTTDENGSATVEFKTGAVKAYSTDPVNIWVYGELMGMETQTLRLNASVPYYHSDYIFRVEYEKDLRAVTLRHYNFSGFPDDMVGGEAEGKITWKLHKVVITRTERTSYDSYLKKNVTYYEYHSTDNVIDSKTVDIKGRLELPIHKVEGFTGYYYYGIFFNDGRATFEQTISATPYRYYSTNDGISVELELDKDAYAVGDRIGAAFLFGGKKENALFALFANGLADYRTGDSYIGTYTSEMIPGAYLYGVFFNNDTGDYTYKYQKIAYNFSSAATIGLTITPDKESYKPGDSATVTVKATSGNGATVLLSVVDEACFALGYQKIDAPTSFFTSLGSANAGYRYSYYYDYLDYYYYNYNRVKNVVVNASFPLYISFDETGEPEAEEPAEGGENAYYVDKAIANNDRNAGGDSYYLRKYFADNPEFRVITLNDKGEGTLVFTVPDNLTTWRITAVASAGKGGNLSDMRVGSGVSQMVCTQSFFVQPGACSEYIVGDDVSLSLRSYGKNAEGKVSYRVVLLDGAGKEIAEKTVESAPLSHAWIHFGTLEAGQYVYRVYADCGEEKDAVEGRFSVTSSVAVVDVRKELDPKDLSKIAPLLYPVTLTFFDEDSAARQQFSEIYSTLVWRNAGAARLDALIARHVAALAAERLYGTDEHPDAAALKQQLTDYFRDPYYSLLTYSESDPALTALVLALGVEDVDAALTASAREQLISTYTSKISSSAQRDPADLCASLLALAALGEPVLDHLYSVLNEAGGYTVEAKLYLAAAFANIGDFGGAKELLTAIVKEYGDENKTRGTMHIQADSVSESMRLTELFLFAASRVARTDAEKAAHYLVTSFSEDERGLLGLACYLHFYMPTEKPEKKSVSYKIGDKDYTVEVDCLHYSSVVLNKAEFAQFSVTDAPKGVKVRAFYKGAPEDAREGNKPSDRLQIEKSYAKNSDGTYTVTLKITGRSKCICESFELSDFIPTGARFVMLRSDGYNADYNDRIRTYGYIYNEAGQRMRGYVGVYNKAEADRNRDNRSFSNDCAEYSFSVSVSYVVRGAVEGTFVSDSALLRDASGAYAVSERTRIGVYEKSDWKFDV